MTTNKMGTTKNIIDALSPHLFWDVNRDNLSFVKNKKIIIQRVLEYGLENDWMIISDHYGIKEIAETALCLKELDKKSLSFISMLATTKTPRRTLI